MAARKKAKIDYVYSSGRRKESSARARVYKGKLESMVNGMPFSDYFPGNLNKVRWEKPFHLTDSFGKYYATVKVDGGGKESQLEAALLAIAKSLAKIDKEAFRPTLKKSGYLTRDARIRERRKVGTGGKARRKKQSPKR